MRAELGALAFVIGLFVLMAVVAKHHQSPTPKYEPARECDVVKPFWLDHTLYSWGRVPCKWMKLEQDV